MRFPVPFARPRRGATFGNGITLCNRCHISWHRGGRVIPRALFTADEWAYLSSLTLTGRETAAWLDKHYPPQEVAA